MQSSSLFCHTNPTVVVFKNPHLISSIPPWNKQDSSSTSSSFQPGYPSIDATELLNTATIASTFLRRFFRTAAPLSPEAMSAATQKAQGLIDENTVMVFSKSYCPYCRQTKQLLSELGARFEVIELDQIGE